MSSAQYRIERAKTGRAGCTDTHCKKEGVKIPQGDLRLGTWVEIQDHGSWKWRHWGCVSGHQIQSIRDSADGLNDTYDWDLVDGYDELPSDLQDKFRKAIEQGFIDPEDFKGDPECNVLGNKGIHLTAAQKRKMEAAAAGEDDAPKAKKGTKRGRKKADDDDDEEVKPAKKARQGKRSKVKAEDDEEEAAEEVKPQTKTPRGKKAKAEPEAEETRPAGRRSSQRAVPIKSLKEESGSEDEKPAKKGRAKKGRAKKAKVESESEPEIATEEDDASGPEAEPESEPEPEQPKRPTKTPTKTPAKTRRAAAGSRRGRK